MEDRIKYYSVLEEKINNFISDFGIDQLICYLEDYGKNMTKQNYEDFNTIKHIVCREYSIPLAEIDTKYISPMHKDLRMTIAYISYSIKNLSTNNIAQLMSASRKAIKNYLGDCRYRIDHQKIFPEFNEKYNTIIEKVKHDKAKN